MRRVPGVRAVSLGLVGLSGRQFRLVERHVTDALRADAQFRVYIATRTRDPDVHGTVTAMPPHRLEQLIGEAPPVLAMQQQVGAIRGRSISRQIGGNHGDPVTTRRRLKDGRVAGLDAKHFNVFLTAAREASAQLSAAIGGDVGDWLDVTGERPRGSARGDWMG